MLTHNTHYSTNKRTNKSKIPSKFFPVPLEKNCSSFLIASALVKNDCNVGQIFCFTCDGVFWWTFVIDGFHLNSIPFYSWQNLLSDVVSFCRSAHYLNPVWSKK